MTRCSLALLLSLSSLAGLFPGPALGLSLVGSVADAASDEAGEDPGSDVDHAQTSTPGARASASAVRCLGAGLCAVPPEFDGAGASARASTDFGENRARVYGNSGVDPRSSEETVNDIVDTASASSLWVDEWTFAVTPGSLGLAVLIELHLEGSWNNTGRALFAAAVADPLLSPIDNPDDPNPFLDLDGRALSSVSFDNRSPIAFNGAAPFIVPIPDGGEADGNAELGFMLRFVPQPGQTYLVAARLAASTSGQLDGESADFESTARVTRVVLPEGITFTSAAGASWNAVVPEPSSILLGAASALALAARRRFAGYQNLHQGFGLR